jgi:hypothetical protein
MTCGASTSRACPWRDQGANRGLVPHRRRAALRSTDNHRCRQPFSDRVPHCSGDDPGSAAGGRAGLWRARSATRDPQRQQLAPAEAGSAPFASTSSPGGLTRLSVQWVKPGIRLERIEPGAQQQNGRHERMHATLKAETSRPPAAPAAEQQAGFDRFRNDFNDNRPHEALGQVPPTSRYRRRRGPTPIRSRSRGTMLIMPCARSAAMARSAGAAR